jgi:hypothetical protein
MTLHLAPADIGEAMALYLDLVPQKPVNVRTAMLQLVRSRRDGFYAGGELIAVASYYPLPPETAGERLFELAFVCRPALARHLVSFMHLAHLTPRRLANDGPVRVRAHVRRGHLPGARLARLCRMTFTGVVGGFERWEFARGAPDGTIRTGDQDAVLRA